MWNANQEIYGVFKLQKRAVRIIEKLKMTGSCKLAFENLRILTFSSQYILETTQFRNIILPEGVLYKLMMQEAEAGTGL